MDNVIDITDAGPHASVLTETGGGILGRALLADDPLETRLSDAETPRYVLRNKAGVTVERPDGTESISPAGRYSGLALVSDVRLLFAVGGRDGDRTLSVSLADVVDVRIDDGRHGALVVETVTDERIEFPCKGDLAPVREFLDAAVGIWTRAERRVERAEAQFDELRSAFEGGEVDVVLATIGDVREKLDAAREEAGPLDGARERIGERVDAVNADLAGMERRAYAEQAEQARERAHVRWDDHEYEEAFDHLDDAAEAYAAASDIDADRPSDDLLERRRETLADERTRLAAAPLDRAEHAADVADTAEDPGAAIDWWEAAVERYETAMSLDWGRDDRRFEGDRAELREELATSASNLVSAYCDLARDHLADGDDDRDTNPDAARVAYDLAADALEEARAVARERAPESAAEIDDVRETLEERRAKLPASDGPAGAEVDGGRAATKQTIVEHPDAGSGEATSEDDPGTDAAPTDQVTAGEAPTETASPSEGPTDGASATPADTATPAGEPVDSTAEPGAGTTTTDADNIARSDRPRVETDSSDDAPAAERIDPTTVDPARLPDLVATLFWESGWATTVTDAETERAYDLLVETASPVRVAACVWTVHPDTVEAVDAARVERCAAYLDRAEEGDAAVLCSAAPISPTARERADEYGVRVLDADDLAQQLVDHGVRPSDI